MLESFEPVTICDQFIFLCFSKLKSELNRKSFDIPFNCLIEYFSSNLIYLSQISIKYNLNTTKGENHTLDVLDGYDLIIMVHH